MYVIIHRQITYYARFMRIVSLVTLKNRVDNLFKIVSLDDPTRKVWLRLWILLATGGVLLMLGVSVGSTGLDSLLSIWQDPVAMQIVWDIRLPRSLGAWAAGALLGLSGALAQGLFRNPLADPYLLGSASGATLGVALGLAFLGLSPFAAHGLARVGLTGMAFAGAMVAVTLTLMLARGVQHTLRLLLAGVIVGVVLGAGVSLVMLLTPDVMQSMQGFLLGSTGLVSWSAWGTMVGVWLVCMTVSWLLGTMLDGLSLGEDTAASLGLPLLPMRIALVTVLALATGTAVAQTGLIAFVGLAAPHLVRSWVSTTHARLMLLSSLMGGVLLMAADTLARWLIAPQELPVGVLTAILGGGYLLWLMHRQTPGNVA